MFIVSTKTEYEPKKEKLKDFELAGRYLEAKII